MLIKAKPGLFSLSSSSAQSAASRCYEEHIIQALEIRVPCSDATVCLALFAFEVFHPKWVIMVTKF